jgi:hypothetical protein
VDANARLKQLSPGDLAVLGLHGVAYIRPLTIDGVLAFGIFSADGNRIAVLPSREMAEMAVWRNDLELVTVH